MRENEDKDIVLYLATLYTIIMINRCLTFEIEEFCRSKRKISHFEKVLLLYYAWEIETASWMEINKTHFINSFDDIFSIL